MSCSCACACRAVVHKSSLACSWSYARCTAWRLSATRSSFFWMAYSDRALLVVASPSVRDGFVGGARSHRRDAPKPGLSQPVAFEHISSRHWACRDTSS
eukprot:scaffold259318_cov32-Tisochrysis_lutea.AAC.1